MGAFAASHGCTDRDSKPIRQGGFDRRRLLLAGGGGLVCALAGLRPAAAGELPKGAVNRTFEIFRKGERIGRNRVVFRPTGSGFEVATEIDIAVKMAFITAYRYRQEANDRWQNGLCHTRARLHAGRARDHPRRRPSRGGEPLHARRLARPRRPHLVRRRGPLGAGGDQDARRAHRVPPRGVSRFGRVGSMARERAGASLPLSPA